MCNYVTLDGQLFLLTGIVERALVMKASHFCALWSYSIVSYKRVRRQYHSTGTCKVLFCYSFLFMHFPHLIPIVVSLWPVEVYTIQLSMRAIFIIPPWNEDGFQYRHLTSASTVVKGSPATQQLASSIPLPQPLKYRFWLITDPLSRLCTTQICLGLDTPCWVFPKIKHWLSIIDPYLLSHPHGVYFLKVNKKL